MYFIREQSYKRVMNDSLHGCMLYWFTSSLIFQGLICFSYLDELEGVSGRNSNEDPVQASCCDASTGGFKLNVDKSSKGMLFKVNMAN